MKRAQAPKAILALTVALLLCLLPACGGGQILSSITARNSISGNQFSANLFVRHGNCGGSYTSFASSKSLSELKDQVKKRANGAGTLEAAIYQEKYVLFTQQVGDVTAFFLLACVPNLGRDTQPRYALFAPVASFGEEEMGDGKSLIYFPYHMLKGADIELYPGQSVIPDGTAYPADAGIEAFEAFYQALYYCEVSRNGDALRVKNTRSGRTILLTFYEEQGAEMVRFSLIGQEA